MGTKAEQKLNMIKKELTSEEFDELEKIVQKYMESDANYVSKRFSKVEEIIEILELSKDDRERLNWAIEMAIDEIQHVIESHTNCDLRRELVEWIEK